MTIVRLPMLLAVLGIAALLASACGEGGSAEPAKTLEVALPNGAALPPTVIPSPTPCPPEGCPTLSEVKKLTASDAQAGDHFGSSVVVSGDTAIVGSGFRDVAYVFERDQGGPGNWGEVKKLTARADDAFGVSVAVSGDTAVVGAPVTDGGRSDTDSAYVFQRNEGGPGNWGQVTKLTGSDAQAGDFFGSSVAISGDTVIVAAPAISLVRIGTGAVYVFVRDEGGPGNWGEVKKLTASDAEDEDWFGGSVAISGDTALVGAQREDADTGAAYLFQRNEGGADNWGQVTKLTGSDAQAGDSFGNSLSIGGDTVAVGASFAVYLFQRDEGGPGNWAEVTKLIATDAQADHEFGTSVAISRDTVLVGASQKFYVAGAAYVFQRNEGGANNWGQVSRLTASDAQAGDGPVRVAISGGTVVIGAHGEGGPGIFTGAAYVFEHE